jgi:uncharacterized membrane protein YhaH (DUF805 family)
MKQALLSVFIKDIFNYKEPMGRKAYWLTIVFICLFLLLVNIPLSIILVLPTLAAIITNHSLTLFLIIGIRVLVWIWIVLAIFSATVRRFRSVGVPVWTTIYLPVTLALSPFIGLELFVLGLFAAIIISIMPDKNKTLASSPEVLSPSPNEEGTSLQKEIGIPGVLEEKNKPSSKKKSKLWLWLTLGLIGFISLPILVFPPILNAIQQQSNSGDAGFAALQVCGNFEKAYIAYHISNENEEGDAAYQDLQDGLEVLRSANNSEYKTLLEIFNTTTTTYDTDLVVLECTRLGYPILANY